MEDTQLTTGAQPPEVFCSSDNTSGCVVLPILPYEAEVGWPSQCCVQSMCWNRNVSGFKMLRQVLAAGKAFASPSLFYCRDRQEERGPHWPRLPTFMPWDGQLNQLFTEVSTPIGPWGWILLHHSLQEPGPECLAALQNGSKLWRTNCKFSCNVPGRI